MTAQGHADAAAAGDRVDLRRLVREAAGRLAAAGVEGDWYDAGILATHVLGVEPRDLVLHDTCTREQAEAFEDLVSRRCSRIPLQHLTGRAYFRRLSLVVGPGVFVPRPETEVVVEAVLTEVEAMTGEGIENPLVVDLCTGSGAIAASVAVEAPQTRVAAVELSAEAHAWADRNLWGLGVDLRLGDAIEAFQDLDGTVDVVVSNPPYIPHGAVIRDPEVLEHDPAVALWGGGDDGLDVMRGIAARAIGLLRVGGLVVVEHADVQGGAVVALLETTGAFVDVTDHPDLAGRDRYTTARRAAQGSLS
jgi:release factor glutamine methyltransferase